MADSLAGPCTRQQDLALEVAAAGEETIGLGSLKVAGMPVLY